MVKFNNSIPSKHLAEEDQKNPLRWIILYREEDGSFTYQSPMMKCKDYFNDLVSKLYGHDVIIYGFNTADVTLNNDYVWIQLTNLIPEWHTNMQKWFTPMYEKRFSTPIEYLKVNETSYVIGLPIEVFSHTYLVSFATLCIRLCNNPDPLNPKYSEKDYVFNPTFKFFEDGFFPPKEIFNYLAVYNTQQRIRTPEEFQNTKIPSSIIHNSGIYHWKNLVKNCPEWLTILEKVEA